MALAAISLQQSFTNPLYLTSSSNFHNKSNIRNKKSRSTPPPIFISTNPSHLNIHHLRDLFFSANLSCHRFPRLLLDDTRGGGRVVEPVDLDKLRTAVRHSSVVVSAFCRPEFCEGDGWRWEETEEPELGGIGFGGLLRRAAAVAASAPLSESNGRLVGFGRAVSDRGLTASIYDVAVIPSLQGLGIGSMIVKRIIRVLTSGGIYDIAALCSEKERLFFEACGFKEDALGSTTMMYTQAATSPVEDDLLVKRAGRMLLFVPPTREPAVPSMMAPIDEREV